MTDGGPVVGTGAGPSRPDSVAPRLVVPGGADTVTALARLGLPVGSGRPVIVVCGGADDLRDAELARAAAVLGPAVRSAVEVTGAAVVDGGTASGVMLLVDRARDGHETTMPVLLGVAPAGAVADGAAPGRAALAGHHTHFLLADSDRFGDETDLLIDAAAALAQDHRVVMVLAGGGPVAQTEALAAVRRGWPVIVLAGTGGTADRIAAATSAPTNGRESDPDWQEIAQHPAIRVCHPTGPGQLARDIAWDVQDEPVLKSAWTTFATYDNTAAGLRATFERLQSTILGLGVLATLLALLHQVWGGSVLHWAAVAAPITASVLIAFANRRASGKRWVLLRAAAEETKSEIFRYRTRTGAYRDAVGGLDPRFARSAVLATRLDAIEARLMQTEAISGPLTPYAGVLPPPMYGAGQDDDGLSRLTPTRYLDIRVTDQLRYYHGRVRRMDRRRIVLQAIAVAGGGVGTLLAASGHEVWVGLTTVIASAALAYTYYLQIDATMVAYNQSAGRLTSLMRGWAAHDADDPDAASRFADLVTHAEDAVVTELGGWVQQMNNALQELRKAQAEEARQGSDPQATA